MDVRLVEAAVCRVLTDSGAAMGFLFASPLLVVTAQHAIAEPSGLGSVRVAFGDGLPVVARVHFRHSLVDLAALKLPGPLPDVPPLLPHEGQYLEEPPMLLWATGGGSSGDDAPGRRGPRLAAIPQVQRTRRARDGYEEELLMFSAPDGGPGQSG